MIPRQHSTAIIMPQEIVKHYNVQQPRIAISDWLSAGNFNAENYTDTRIAILETTGKRERFDYTYKVTEVRDDGYVDAFMRGENVILLGVPLRADMADTIWLKLNDGERFCNLRKNGNESEPSWCHSLHADLARAGNFVLYATKSGEDFKLQLGVCISIIETMRFHYATVPEFKALFERIFDMLQLSDNLEKYIACIVMDEEYSSYALETVFRTAINRNAKWTKDNFSSSAALLILLPMVGQLFKDTDSPAIRQSLVAGMEKEYHANLASVNIRAERENRDWVDVLCSLADSFGIQSGDVDRLRPELEIMQETKALYIKFDLQKDPISYVSDVGDNMRTRKLGGGFIADGLHSQTRCHFTLEPSLMDDRKPYSVEFDGRGFISVVSLLLTVEEISMVASAPFTISVDQQMSMCMISQGDNEFTVTCESLMIRFWGGSVTVLPS